jgi:ligand-binding sensor protein
MESLNVALPPALMYDSAESRAILSTRRSISIKPTTGTSVSSASTSDIVQFKLPNSGVLANCYLRYKITGSLTAGSSSSSNTRQASQLVCDPFAPSAAMIRRLVVASSDGTEITNVNNYHHYCSIMARYKNSKDWSETYGANTEGTPAFPEGDAGFVGFNNTAVNEGGSTDHGAAGIGIGLHKGWEMNAKRLARDWNGDNTIVHKFQAGILDQKNDAMLPLALLGSGMNVYLHLADKDEVFRAVPDQDNDSTTLGSALDLHPQTDAGVASYSLSDIELVCDLLYYPPEVTASIQEKLCSGLKVRCDRIRVQTNAVSQESNVVILNEHARSVNAVIFGVRNSAEKSNGRREENEYYKQPAHNSSALKEFQLQVGSENVPTNPCKFGSQSFVELEKAMKAVFDEDFKFGNQIRVADYEKVQVQDTASAGSGGAGATPGSAIMGVNLKSHPEIPSIMSGKSASSGSIPISLTLDFDGGSNLGSAELETFVISDQVVEFLADGSALVHK